MYQAAHIHQYVLEFKPIIRWVRLQAAEAKYESLPPAEPRVVIRRPARNTDERTTIAGVLPGRSCFGDTLTAAYVDPVAHGALVNLLNSFAFDYAIRLRVAGIDLRPYQLAVVAVPPPSRLDRPAEIACVSVGGATAWIYEDEESWKPLWLGNRAIAEAYGLGPDDFEHILSTFPVFARKRPAFYAYLRERLAEWKEEVGLAGRRIPYPETASRPELRVAEGPPESKGSP